MNPTLQAFVDGHLSTLLGLANPLLFNVFALVLATIIIVDPLPLTPRDEDTSTVDLLLIWSRRAGLIVLISLAVVLPFYLFFLYGLAHAELPDADANARGVLKDILAKDWWRIVAGGIVGLAIKGIFDRYVAPPLSAWMRDIRIKTIQDKQSDVREVIGELQPKHFLPAAYYKPEWVFFGLGKNGTPLYVDLKTFRETNTQIVGPTRYGKGVLLGALAEQSIQLGHSFIYVDPKDDKWLPWILYQTAAPAKKRFVVIDLNSDKTGWHPFVGGELRDRRERIVSACGLYSAGTDADYYKRMERGILDRILPTSPGTIRSLLDALEALDGDDVPLKKKAAALYEGLKELAMIPALNPKGVGMTTESIIRNGWTCYFRGSLRDRTKLMATRLFVTEVLQQAKNLKAERGANHLTFAIDELKFLVSKEVSDALATSLSDNVNIIVLHQSMQDLRGIEDKLLDKNAIEKSIDVNCQIKIVYKCDPETAEWAELKSGTKLVKIARMERTAINRFGGEVFEHERSMGDVEEGLISQNVLLTLPPMIGVFFTPTELAQVVFTSPVKTDIGDALFKEHPVYSEWKIANGKKVDGGFKPAGTMKPERAEAALNEPLKHPLTADVKPRERLNRAPIQPSKPVEKPAQTTNGALPSLSPPGAPALEINPVARSSSTAAAETVEPKPL